MNYTPGPWELNTQDTGLNDSGTILGAGVVIVPDIYGRSKVESDANTRLIVAAPDLLMALQHIIEEADHEDNEKADDFIEALDWAGIRAALAKATGTTEASPS